MRNDSDFDAFCNGGCAVSNDFKLYIGKDCVEENFLVVPCSPEDSSDWTMTDGASKSTTINMKSCNDIKTYSKFKTYEDKEFTFLLGCENLYDDDFYKLITSLKAGDMFIIKREFSLPDETKQTLYRPYVFGSWSEKFQGDNSSKVMAFSISFTPLADGSEECPSCDDTGGTDLGKKMKVTVK